MSQSRLQDFVEVLKEAGFEKQADALVKYASTPFDEMNSMSVLDPNFQRVAIEPAKIAWSNFLADTIWGQIEGKPAVTKIDKKCSVVAKFLVSKRLVCTEMEVETESNPLPDSWLETDRSAIYTRILESFRPTLQQ